MISQDNSVEVYEWEFDTPSSRVDLGRVILELNYLTAATAIMHMGYLKSKAPIVYKRLRQYCKQFKLLTW